MRLPDFIIIGAQKAGTTFAYSALTGRRSSDPEGREYGHPLIDPAARKELHFFDTPAFFNKGIDWYSQQFPEPTEPYNDGRETITGEASPYYLFHPHAARRAAEVVPDAKLIVFLRDPVERAYSDWRHTMLGPGEELSFEDAIEAEEERLAGELEKMLEDERYRSRPHRRYSYLARGVYLPQLEEWFYHFDRRQFLIVESSDLHNTPHQELSRMQRFLGVVEQELDLPHGSNASAAREEEAGMEAVPPMKPVTRERLRGYFEPHNQRLYKYLGRNFGW
ncbi:MAG: hypothetical protein AVDCRST_MAG93-9541 [uncultured Chloroflexia bacterium]|uniref:Sulfotransferase domain-containing protein n=1 Tax=uncultured Chloroflexia bacterium TaxID=1672391 RepID=A0A6J4NGV6_9CHLR|nr:MAG: hypothetical protein AVDCRST_MAG93-9541 [uncultured Chloroflexia bacterium]